MKKYLKEKGLQAFNWANIREDSNMNMQMQKLAEDSLKNLSDANRNYQKQKKVMSHYEEAMWTIQKNRSAFEETSDNRVILYPLNNIFMETLEKFNFSSLEIGEIIAYMLKQNYEIVKKGQFVISNFEIEKKYEKMLKQTNNTQQIFLKMLFCKLKGISYTDVLDVAEKEIVLFEEYYEKVNVSRERYKKVYCKLIAIIKNNPLSQIDINAIKNLLTMVKVDEAVIDNFVIYLKAVRQTIIASPKRSSKQDQIKTLSRNEIRRRLANYYDMNKGKVTKEFDYSNFKEVLMSLKSLNMLEKRNDVIFKELSENPFLNNDYFAYLYQKLQFQYPNKEELYLINTYLEEIKNCSEEDALFWQEQIKKILLSLRGELNKSFRYENFVLKLAKTNN